MASLDEALSRLQPVTDTAAAAADERQSELTKPPGALGALESLGSRLAAIAGRCPPPIPSRPVVAVFAGDHGVLAEGVSPWPAEVTAQMVANFLGGGAAINVIAREVGAAVIAIDVGVATPIPGPSPSRAKQGSPGPTAPSEPDRLVSANVRPGTANLAREPAMSLSEARQAIQAGLSVADRLVDQGADLLVTGDMGIGNTTPSAALIAAITGWPARAVTGRGTGISDATFELKVTVVEAGLARAAAAHSLAVSALGSLSADLLLSEVGGLEIGAIAGLAIGGALRRVPVVVDGVISLAAALVACSLAPEVGGYLVAGHRSVEPGATAALEHLGLEPLLDLRLRLGEGTGACLAVPIVRAAARLLNEMATFGDAGVSGSTEL
ncbi:MAG: nicotinate-nucleotide--dimethylbenzimidazole phosphoribosyltransferase [Acidimicrobiales bacterium]